MRDASQVVLLLTHWHRPFLMRIIARSSLEIEFLYTAEVWLFTGLVIGFGCETNLDASKYVAS